MPFNAAAVKQHLRAFDFRTLFITELGWDKPGAGLDAPLDGRTFRFTALAEKRGLQVFECVIPAADDFPDYATRLKLERQVVKLAQENILIFTDAAKSRQTWLWVKREAGGPPRSRHETFAAGDTGERLAQKLQHLVVELDEEEKLTLPDVTQRRKQAFDVEKITKKFFERFQQEHAAFLKFIKGLPAESQAWYASLMLNRLMFVYFIQKKGFLNNDPDYLRNKLTEVQQRKGKDKFVTFYKHFLMRLFHEGLGKKKKERKAEFDTLLGDVPYLNGGLFDVHELEAANADIQIPDAAFTKLFAFFDTYQWHLDDRPLRADNEINPDVLGFIFEKYINQKQMGAYYTKEDITGYITRNALLPFVLSRVRELCAVAFQPGGTVWKMLADDPDRYIYPAVRHGVDLPLPKEIAAGIADVSRRGGWNRSAADGFALPTETWREHVARRQRCHDLRARLREGRVTAVNDLVTLNLDIVRFVTDLIEECEGADLLRAVYQTLTKVSVLDPTCGSGAFLFAALNILEPLYDACLERMQGFVAEADAVKPLAASRERHADFRDVLTEAELHPNRRYFIFRSVVVNNLYGVDIMPEAVEICKLRLFLKLVSQVERGQVIEALPDIDFNIRPGNTLVGFASLAEARKAMKGGLDFGGEADELEKEGSLLAQYFNIFRDHQTKMREELGKEPQLALNVSKQYLRKRLREASDKLDHYLAGVYGVDPDDEKKYAKWHDSHQPFHWFAEFYGIMAAGGFDVVIGNPPYVEYRLVRGTYTIQAKQYKAGETGNLYCFCLERASNLTSRNGYSGMIVPSSLLGLDEVLPLRKHLLSRFAQNWFSTYAIRPSKLFEGVDQRLCIHLAGPDATRSERPSTTHYQHWCAEERPILLQNLCYHSSFVYEPLNRVAQLGTTVAGQVLRKLLSRSDRPISAFYSDSDSAYLMHYHRSPRYWIRAMDFEQYFKSATRNRSVHHFRDIHFTSKEAGKVAGAIINSSLFFFWFLTVCNGRNLAGIDVEQFPVGKVDAGLTKEITRCFDALMKDFKANSLIRKRQDCEFQEFRPSKSKPIIDQIDALLAKHYGFTAAELDFIVNYDIKYRLGAEDDESEE